MSRVYATADDYQTWSGDLTISPSAAQLRAASAKLDNAIRGTVYDVDTDTGLPTDTDVAEAFQDAACAIIQYWEEIGDPLGLGAAAQFQSASIGSASYTRATQAAPTTALPQTAIDILLAANLLSVDPYTYG